MKAEQFLKRKERLLITAIQLMDESGTAGVTTREMAKRDGITEPAVYRHFTGKVDVLMTILDRFGAFDDNLENTVRENHLAPVSGIYHICLTHAAYYSGYPQITNVLFSLDLWKYDPTMEARMKEIMLKRHHLMLELVQEGIAAGEISRKTKPETLADILANIVVASTRQWRLEDMKYDLVDRIREMLELILPFDETTESGYSSK